MNRLICLRHPAAWRVPSRPCAAKIPVARMVQPVTSRPLMQLLRLNPGRGATLAAGRGQSAPHGVNTTSGSALWSLVISQRLVLVACTRELYHASLKSLSEPAQ